ncbi:MAG: DUF1707 domain-containing protein [Solirubrobacteraceae bacterium]
MYGYDGYDYGTTPDPSVRAADADREATADRLRQHHAEGRIDVTEFQERLDRTYEAKTVGELRQLVTDLPRDPQPGPFGRGPHLRSVLMGPWIPILFLIIAISALSGHHHGGLWVLIPLFFVARLLFWGHRPWSRRRYGNPQA